MRQSTHTSPNGCKRLRVHTPCSYARAISPAPCLPARPRARAPVEGTPSSAHDPSDSTITTARLFSQCWMLKGYGTLCCCCRPACSSCQSPVGSGNTTSRSCTARAGSIKQASKCASKRTIRVFRCAGLKLHGRSILLKASGTKQIGKSPRLRAVRVPHADHVRMHGQCTCFVQPAPGSGAERPAGGLAAAWGGLHHDNMLITVAGNPDRGRCTPPGCTGM